MYNDSGGAAPGGPDPIAFVLGGGGIRGAVEVGQARALLEAGIEPDLVVGTSVGAINGAMIAHTPTIDVLDRLVAAWSSDLARRVYGQPRWQQFARLMRHRNHFNSPVPLQRLLVEQLGGDLEFSDLAIPFFAVAASVERARERWFSSGPLIPAVMASSAVPGILPPVRIDGEHFYDGGLVASIPLGRAIEEGARTIYVLQVGRIEEPLRRPTNVIGSVRVPFEISRRHRFARELSQVPEGVTVHVMPSGGLEPGGVGNASIPTLKGSRDRMQLAYEHSAEFLSAPEDRRPGWNPEGDLSIESYRGMTVKGGDAGRFPADVA